MAIVFYLIFAFFIAISLLPIIYSILHYINKEK